MFIRPANAQIETKCGRLKVNGGELFFECAGEGERD